MIIKKRERCSLFLLKNNIILINYLNLHRNNFLTKQFYKAIL